jgi:putative ABC transport system permease protein
MDLDLRFALRQLVRSPGFTIVAIVTLALGLGANSALYSVADAILQRPRPGIAAASELLWIGATSRERSRPSGISYQVAERLRTDVRAFERIATIRDVPLSMSTTGEPLRVKGQAVSGDYFAMLRTPFALGRGLTPMDDRVQGAHPVAVLNYRTWETSFGSDPAIVGRTITLNGLPFTVLGVAGRGFNGAEQDEETRAVWVPASMLVTLLPNWHWMVTDATTSDIRALGRVRSANDRATADAAVSRVAAVIAAGDTTRPAGWTLRTYEASAGLPAGAERVTVPLTALAVVVTGLILFICCANVSNLMLARALARRREIATRLSIGASRSRVVRQLLTEAVLLAILAGVAGFFVASASTRLLLAYALPLQLDVSVDWKVFVVSAMLALSTGVLFGLAPALHATRAGVASALREAAAGGGRRRSRLQGSLVVAQVALSLLLLTLSGLFLRALDKARRVDVGFDASPRVLAVSYDLGLVRYDTARAMAFTDAVVERARALPGVQTVSVTNLLPLTEWSSVSVTIERSTTQASAVPTRGSLSAVGVDYFRTMATPLVAGRDFTSGDAPGAPPVAIVSEQFARQHLGTTAALGARISVDGKNGPWRTIVGVSRDAVVQSIGAPPMGAIYVPIRQRNSGMITVLVRTAGGDAGSLAPAVRNVIHALDPALPVHREATLDEVRDIAMGPQRAGALVLAIFGGLAVVLAAVGLHGVLLFMVRQRTREIGIRMALGATTGGVTKLIVGRGLRLTMIGGAIGIVLALGATQLTRSFLLGIAPTDAITFAAVSGFFALVALVACWIPARRAARIDPLSAIRSE